MNLLALAMAPAVLIWSAPAASPAPTSGDEAQVSPDSEVPTPAPAPAPAPAEDVSFAETPEPQEPVTFQDPSAPADPVVFEEPTPDPTGAVQFDGTERPSPPAEAARTFSVEEAERPSASPQRFAIELKFGPYLPGVDDRYTGPGLGAYAEIFGETDERGVAIDEPRRRVMSKLGFEWQFVNLGGPLSLGTSVGFFRDSAQGLLADTTFDDPTVRSSADRVRFNVLPVTLLLGYRFELLADRFRVPLVPYAKGGLAYGFWWATDGNRDVAVDDNGVKGRGGSVGWQANLGLMLRLDFLERSAARALDSNTGINHTYLFGEWQFSRMDGFGDLLNKVQVGDDTWYLGIAIEL